MSDTSFTNGVTLSDGAGWAQDINNAIYRGSGLSGNTTIASATTPDIFATTTTHTITYTGTTTCTGFVAAPAAGAWRVLNCSGAAVFTAGANMIIPGVGSGSNFTAAANTMILVTALTPTQFLLNIFKADGTPVVSSSGTGIGGVSRKSQMSITAASATGTLTADEILVETALGGSVLVLSSYSQACNLATTGAGGMDTGTAPVNGFVSIYAIAKSDGTKNVLACAVATSSGSVYGGANMPAGYTYSALLGIIPTNGSSQFKPGLLIDRKWCYQANIAIFTGSTGSSTLTSQSISSAVPAAARYASGFLGKTSTTADFQGSVASDGTGTGVQAAAGVCAASARSMGGIATASVTGGFFFRDVPLITSQTLFWTDSVGNSTSFMDVSEYTV